MVPVHRNNAKHYVWGDGCDGWHLLESDGLSVIEEVVPPGKGEVAHYHVRAQQFFYVLSGRARLELGSGSVVLNAGEGCPIAAGTAHRFLNDGTEEVRFLVISSPKAQGDRVLASTEGARPA